jgi:hypothetical protein
MTNSSPREISGQHDFALTFKREFLNLAMTNLS